MRQQKPWIPSSLKSEMKKLPKSKGYPNQLEASQIIHLQSRTSWQRISRPTDMRASSNSLVDAVTQKTMMMPTSRSWLAEEKRRVSWFGSGEVKVGLRVKHIARPPSQRKRINVIQRSQCRQRPIRPRRHLLMMRSRNQWRFQNLLPRKLKNNR